MELDPIVYTIAIKPFPFLKKNIEIRFISKGIFTIDFSAKMAWPLFHKTPKTALYRPEGLCKDDVDVFMFYEIEA